MVSKKIQTIVEISAILVSIVSIVAAYAIFATSDKMTNVLNIGEVNVEMWEYFDTDNDKVCELYGPKDNDVLNFAPKFRPTDVILKKPYLTNVGDVDSYIYFVVGVPTGSVLQNADDENYTVKEIFVLSDVGEKWTDITDNVSASNLEGKINITFSSISNFSSENCNWYLYSYQDILKPGNTTDNLFNSIKVIDYSAIDSSEIYALQVYAIAMQTNGSVGNNSIDAIKYYLGETK